MDTHSSLVEGRKLSGITIKMAQKRERAPYVSACSGQMVSK
jgi:hypothetical protein